MKSIIKEIYYGNVRETGKPIKEFLQTTEYKNMNKAFDVFNNSLTPEQRKLYGIFEEKESAFNCLLSEKTYINGVKLGMCLILELLNFDPTN